MFRNIGRFAEAAEKIADAAGRAVDAFERIAEALEAANVEDEYEENDDEGAAFEARDFARKLTSDDFRSREPGPRPSEIAMAESSRIRREREAKEDEIRKRIREEEIQP